MRPILGRFTDLAHFLLRVMAGLFFAQHGAQKLFGVLGGTQQLGNPLLFTAGVVELVGGLLVAIGLFTSVAAFIASGQMAVAYFMSHAPRGFWPVENKGELAALFCFVFLYVAARGSGRWAVRPDR